MSHRFSVVALLLWAVLVASVLAAGCARSGQNQSTAQPSNPKATSSQGTEGTSWGGKLPRDDLGRAVKLQSVPRRVITLGPGATETVFALGVGNRLVGRDSASDYPQAALQVPVIGDFNGLFLERVIAARPDLIIVQGETWGKARVEEWQQKCGVPVAALSANTVAGVARGIEKIGAWLDARSKVRKVVQGLAPPRVTIGRGRVHVFFEVSRSPLWTAGQGSLIDDAIRLAGLANIAHDVRGYKPFNLETLVVRRPALYIVTQPGLPPFDKSRVLHQLRGVPALRNVQCVSDGGVVVVPADWILRPGPRLGLGVREIARQAHAMVET